MNIYTLSPTVAALCAALFFGGSTPFAKQLLNHIPPILLAGLLYAGSGLGLSIVRIIRDKGWSHSGLKTNEWGWMLGAIAFGGILGPILLMLGLQQTSAATTSLLLNLEAVLTAVLAWVVFKENTDFRIVFGMLVIVAGGVLLSWPQDNGTDNQVIGPLLIAGACLCWGIDNNFTRMVSTGDPLFIACIKGMSSGIVSITTALLLGANFPAISIIGHAMIVGFFGYGASLVLFVLALRGLGTARTGAYFSTAPFIGAAIAILIFHEQTSSLFWIAAGLMGWGVWIHLTENHLHEHTHEPLAHTHSHFHDEHHQHEHNFPWDGKEPHNHPHDHLPIRHAHPHYPDIHHRHNHNK
ncbi:TPA: EamA family transporter [Legionella pneumophila]|nr:DMT family transporter [Legionella pneumophila]HAT8868567.1 EamA family transporter [Legionella pneumophila subsp. pneumophila]HAT7071657.1 EamA family transporter [Legionella pneumophila]HAT8642414.1 EamA family transporter [Legionella pneumophila]HAT8889786.1 EamA family transporter [Legionella pneumophila subsp. pneumophila]HAT8931945.1 EamA family transporter [Legionella pneumophila subsp. pneumophila]